MVVRRVPSSRRPSTRSLSSQPFALHGRLRFWLGASLGDNHISGSWSLTCSQFSINHWELLAVLYGVQGFLPLLRNRSISLFADNTTALAYLRNQGGTHSSLLNSVAQAILHLCEAHRVGLVPQFIPGHLNVLADTLSRRSQVLGSEWTLCFPAFRDLLLLWPATIDLFATSLNHRLPVYFSPMEDPQSAGTDVMMQPWDGLQAYAFPSFSLLQRVIAKVRQSRVEAHVVGSVLASTPLVSGPPGASGGCPSVPSKSEGSTQTASLTSFPPEPPRASPDCVSYIERSSRTFGFSSAVARQLVRCRRSSTRVNYQAKWSVYRAWCARHGHSVSHPSVVASFLLYLRRSLSYSSITLYRSMLSVVFRFVLPELSSHFVLCDLHSLLLERPLPSCRIPPWDLSLVLSFLQGPPFEPLSSCSLRDLTRKVLFLLSLATARRVGELQALSSQVSSSGDDLFLSYLPEFRVKTETSIHPLPHCFPVRPLRDFVGSLPDELLLCSVRALRLYLSRTASLPSCPCSLFVSPRSPSRSLSKNALSFFIHDVIAEAYFSAGRSLPSAPSSSSSSSSRPRSSLRAHGVRGVAASWAFFHNAPLASILEAATWSSPSVFSSFYLSNVQFSSSSAYGLGPLIAFGSVV